MVSLISSPYVARAFAIAVVIAGVHKVWLLNLHHRTRAGKCARLPKHAMSSREGVGSSLSPTRKPRPRSGKCAAKARPLVVAHVGKDHRVLLLRDVHPHLAPEQSRVLLWCHGD